MSSQSVQRKGESEEEEGRVLRISRQSHRRGGSRMEGDQGYEGTRERYGGGGGGLRCWESDNKR